MSVRVPALGSMAKDSKLRPGYVVTIILVVGFAVWMGYRIMFKPSPTQLAAMAAPVATPVVLSVPPAEVEPLIVPVLVTQTVTVTVPGPVQYIQVAGPERVVDRVVQVEQLHLAPARGFVDVCIYGEGLTGIYRDGIGLVGNACETLPLRSVSERFVYEFTR